MAMVSGGVGAAALIAGGIFGVKAFSTWDERNRLCPDDRCATPAAQRAQRSSERAARNANVAVGVGFVSLVAAGLLYFLPESDEAVASSAPALTLGGHALLSPNEIGASLQGSW